METSQCTASNIYELLSNIFEAVRGTPPSLFRPSCHSSTEVMLIVIQKPDKTGEDNITQSTSLKCVNFSLFFT